MSKNDSIATNNGFVILSRRRRIPAFVLLPSLCLVAGVTQHVVAQNNSTVPAKTAQPTKPFTFEVVSIHPYPSNVLPYAAVEYLPDGLKLHGMNLGSIIRIIYSKPGTSSNLSTEVQNAPAWFYKDKFDIDARVAKEDQNAWQQGEKDDLGSAVARSALLAMLEDRAKLAVHLTTHDGPCLDLVVGSHGPKLSPTVPGAVKPVPGKTYKLGDGFAIQQNGSEQFVGVSMPELALRLSRAGNWEMTIQDKTGLTGRYDFTLPWYGQDPNAIGLDRMPISGIGLALKPGTAPVTVINIDHIERPDAN